jgi:acetolactate synthase I/II/III large subunit
LETMNGGQLAAATLAEFGVKTIFSVSGNQILPLYDALPDVGIRIVHMRHESAAAYAAAGSSEITGEPGVLLVSAGPGHIAALTGVAVAASMELPMLYLSGASAIGSRGRGAFQEIDQRQIVRAVCKDALEATSVDQIRPTLARAWRLAVTGVPGPVHVSLPVDLLEETTTSMQRIQMQVVSDSLSSTDRSTLTRMSTALAEARRPLVIARPSAGRGEAGEMLVDLTKHLHIEPVITECPRGLSDLRYAEIVRRYPESDCVLVIGPADFSVGFLSENVLATNGRVLLIDAQDDPVPERKPSLHATVAAEQALAHIIERLTEPVATDPGWAAQWPFTAVVNGSGSSEPVGMHPLDVAKVVREELGPDDVVVLDGGEFCQWMRLGLRDAPCPVLWNGKLGAIGGAIPMAVGVRAAGHTGRLIVALGDGSAGYHLSEFETATRYGFAFTAIVGNDARWAAEWHQQIDRYGSDRTFETSLLPARYDQAAIGFGGAGAHVTDVVALAYSLSASLPATQPTLLNVPVLPMRSPAELL